MKEGVIVDSQSIRVYHDRLMSFCAKVLSGAGLSAEDATLMADHLVRADARGVNSHGVMRLPFYVERLVQKGSKAQPEIQVVRDAPSLALVDGDDGLGQIVGTRAMHLAMQKARATGVGIVGVRGSGHFGAAAYYAMLASDTGLIGIAMTNGTPVMVPEGGRIAAISNNPLAAAVPCADAPAIVLDISMSRVAGGKVRLAAKKGERIPTDWIVDQSGRPTDDPKALADGGALMALGHKGYGLAVVVELLAGAMTGAGLLGEIPLWFTETSAPTNIGHCFMAMNPGHFLPYEEFLERVAQVRAQLKATPPAEGVEEVLVPGEIEARREAESMTKGIEISTPVADDLRLMGRRFGADFEPCIVTQQSR